MFDVHVDRQGPLALHEEVAAKICRAIAEGEAGSGERLRPARDLAAVLGVNANTVLRTLRLLRRRGCSNSVVAGGSRSQGRQTEAGCS